MSPPLAPVPPEVEAKLLVPYPTELRALARLERLGPYDVCRRDVQRLRSTYFDTDTLSLARHGIALRLRGGGAYWEITAKWAGRVDGDIHERPELNQPLARAPRRPFVLPDGAIRLRLTAIIAGRPLMPILLTQIHRRRFDVFSAEHTDILLAEMALDRVVLSAPDRPAPRLAYAEVEIEQRHGTRRVIARLAHLLREHFALEPSTDSKFSRGLALLYGPNAPKVSEPAVQGGDSLVVATRKIVASHLRRLRDRDPGTRVGQDPEALHDMRVASRRLRAAARAFEAGMPQRLHTYCTHELKWLGELLGSVRDLDVQLSLLDTYCTTAPADQTESLSGFRRYMLAEHDRLRAGMLAGLDSPRYFHLLIQLERFAQSRPPRRAHGLSPEPIAHVGCRAVAAAFRRLLKRGDRIGDAPTDDDLHALRIRAKRARYLLEFLRGLTGKPGRRLVRHMIRLQDLLGTHHDGVVAAAFIRQYIEGPGAQSPPTALLALGAFMGAERSRADSARTKFHRAWARFARRRHLEDLHALLRQLRKRGSTGA